MFLHTGFSSSASYQCSAPLTTGKVAKSKPVNKLHITRYITILIITFLHAENICRVINIIWFHTKSS